MSRFDRVDMAICDLYRFGYIDRDEAERRAQVNYADARRFAAIKKLYSTYIP